MMKQSYVIFAVSGVSVKMANQQSQLQVEGVDSTDFGLYLFAIYT